MREEITAGGSTAGKRTLLFLLVSVGALFTFTILGGIPAPWAEARGPEYAGTQTQSTGPAYFGPAPNPHPYCDNPTYFDPWHENRDPTGRLDVGDDATVTTDGLTMNFRITAEGNPDTQYPGFFPFGGEGRPNDQAKGIEMGEGDAAVITLDQPMFYTQWIFTDVDQPSEGFSVTPQWTDRSTGEVVSYGGDDQFTFISNGVISTPDLIILDDVDGVGHRSQDVRGRAQIDLLGGVTGISFVRTFPSSGQSGAVVAGGCEASGAAKRVIAGPTWNGTSFDVTYELTLRNNLPSPQTVLDVVAIAQANAKTTYLTDTPKDIPLEQLQLVDQLADPAFSDISVLALESSTSTFNLNPGYNGLDDDEMLLDSSFLAAETDGLLTLSVQYTPDLDLAEWVECSTSYEYLNQSAVSGFAANIAVADLSDDGTDPTPSSENGSGGVDDPTIVSFPCVDAGIDIVKTVLPGPSADCPAFIDGVDGPGEPLEVSVGDVVTYCVTVRNPHAGTAANVTTSDPQAPSPFPVIPLLPGGAEETFSYDRTIDLSTPLINTATTEATGPPGQLGPESDTAVIALLPDEPVLDIVKTVVLGPDGTCPATLADGTRGPGDALRVAEGDTVTYCIAIENAGSGLATNVVISDAQGPGDFELGDLAAGGADAVTYDLLVTQDMETTNTAFVDGRSSTGALPRASDDAIIEIAPLEPLLEIVKTAIHGPSGECPSFADGQPGDGPPLVVSYGDTVTYCLTIQNTGAGTATDVQVLDVQAPQVFALDSLGSGEEATFSYDLVVDADIATRNLAIVTGRGPDGQLPPASDTARIALPESADIKLVHTVIRTDLACADTVEDFDVLVVDLEGLNVRWCYRITNTGDVPLTNMLLSAPAVGLSDLDAIANAGNSLEISIADVQGLTIGRAALQPASIVVMPGETLLIDIETLIPAGGLISWADVIADPSDDQGNLLPLDPVTDEDEAEVREGLISIDKTVIDGADGDCNEAVELVVVEKGSPVTWCFEVTNTGTIDLLVTEVIDETLELRLAMPSDRQRLGPDESHMLKWSGASPGVITNVASVEGLALEVDGTVIEQAPIVRDEDDAALATPVADLKIDKTVSDEGPLPPGTALAYTLEITNDGPDTAHGVLVGDDLPTGLSYTTLPASDDWACALTADERGFACLKATPFPSGESITLTYQVLIDSSAARGRPSRTSPS